MDIIFKQTYLLQNASQFPFAFTGERCFASFTNTCNDPLVFFEHVVDTLEPLLLPELLADELDLILNFLKLNPCECDELDDSLPGINFKPTIMSPR